MEFTNEVLHKMEEKQKYNKIISKYFYILADDMRENKYLRISNNVKDCLSYWKWDKYRQNLVLDLKKVTRCKSRFCSNCRKLDLSRAMNNLGPYFSNLLDDGYYPCLLTLTVPNCPADILRDTINKMQKAFKKFWNWMSRDDHNGYNGKFYKFVGAIRCLEVNYSKKRNDYNAHYHVLAFIDGYCVGEFLKYIPGEWSNNRGCVNMYSDFDEQIRKLWTIAYDNLSIAKYDSLDMLRDTYLCDIREMDSSGIYEVMKYVFKDADIENYYVFRDMYFGLYRVKIRQGYGLLYSVKLENDSLGVEQDILDYLTINDKELPIEIVTHGLETLYTDHANYIKISRFNKDKYVDKIDD